MKVSVCHRALVVDAPRKDMIPRVICGECGASLSESEIREVVDSPPDLEAYIEERIQIDERIS